jgi:AcrR family transcriptional regulator
VTAPLPLSRDRILQCALAVADRDGLDATSLRRVATELGVHVTSLYNHVATKEALLDGIVEELLGSADLPRGVVPWERWVRQFVDEVAALSRTHAGSFAVLLRRPVQGARATATFEAGLAAFQRAGLDDRGCFAAVKSVALSVVGCCVEQAYAGAGGEDLRTDVESLSWQDFPVLHRVTEFAEDVDLVPTLREILVAGLAAQVRAAKKAK